jgi:glycerophosphoryl diester phosphodiesterase
MRRVALVRLGVALALVAFVYVNNTSLLAIAGSGKPVLLAHRGLHQTFSRFGLKSDTCTAARIDPPTHPHLENTLASMAAAFSVGADVVELDVHPTTDGAFVVFHDWTVDCRTNGTGVTRSHTLATLKALDIGFGYTADGGKTFPFRGKGVGLMPTLDEVLSAFPGKRFLIHVKSNEASEGEQLAAKLATLPAPRLADLIVYGGDAPVASFAASLPAVRSMSRSGLKSCVLGYVAIGWTGYVPSACHRSMVLLPTNYTAWLWGWPDRLLQRMRDVGTDVYVLGPWGGGEEFSRGIANERQFRRLPTGYSGGIWTNRIDRIAPMTQR